MLAAILRWMITKGWAQRNCKGWVGNTGHWRKHSLILLRAIGRLDFCNQNKFGLLHIISLLGGWFPWIKINVTCYLASPYWKGFVNVFQLLHVLDLLSDNKQYGLNYSSFQIMNINIFKNLCVGQSLNKFLFKRLCW